MRLVPLLLGLLVAVALTQLTPAADARALACTSVTSTTCPGSVCVDTDLDGHVGSWECEGTMCPHWGCCWTAWCCWSTWGCCWTAACPPPAD